MCSQALFFCCPHAHRKVTLFCGTDDGAIHTHTLLLVGTTATGALGSQVDFFFCFCQRSSETLTGGLHGLPRPETVSKYWAWGRLAVVFLQLASSTSELGVASFADPLPEEHVRQGSYGFGCARDALPSTLLGVVWFSRCVQDLRSDLDHLRGLMEFTSRAARNGVGSNVESVL